MKPKRLQAIASATNSRGAEGGKVARLRGKNAIHPLKHLLLEPAESEDSKPTSRPKPLSLPKERPIPKPPLLLLKKLRLPAQARADAVKKPNFEYEDLLLSDETFEYKFPKPKPKRPKLDPMTPKRPNRSGKGKA